MSFEWANVMVVRFVPLFFLCRFHELAAYVNVLSIRMKSTKSCILDFQTRRTEVLALPIDTCRWIASRGASQTIHAVILADSMSSIPKKQNKKVKCGHAAVQGKGRAGRLLGKSTTTSDSSRKTLKCGCQQTLPAGMSHHSSPGGERGGQVERMRSIDELP